MDQRAVQYPARSVDIRITSEDSKHDFSGDVAQALRHMADAIERDHQNLFKEAPHKENIHERSGFDEPSGVKEFRTNIYICSDGSIFTSRDERVLRIEWCDAAVIDPIDADWPESSRERIEQKQREFDEANAGKFIDPPGGGMPHIYVPDTAEAMIASLTPEEQAALQEPEA